MQTISKWGNSLAVRIPAAFAETVGLEEGTVVEVKVRAGRLIIVPTGTRRYELRELISQITPENSHELIDWGEPAGKENW
jgi:antitoxin MazE